ncbi:helix-turn-helix domain-containing protein [Nocardia rhizosphaerihabitans]|uniref:helix-turn-helix domain-containing protein n=1 Tax=Nocardia rhizosphaerihabitans TaxID=1691570 RepID=UPI00366F9F34
MTLPASLRLGAFVAFHRNAAEPLITQAELAKRASMSSSTLSSIEQGRRKLSVEGLSALVEALELSVMTREHLVRIALPGFFAVADRVPHRTPTPSTVPTSDRVDVDTLEDSCSYCDWLSQIDEVGKVRRSALH